MLSESLQKAIITRRHLVNQTSTNNETIQQDMIAHWEELIEPMLIKVPTKKPNETYNKIKHLFPDWEVEQIKHLANEGDRLFNIANVEPSRVRQVLQDAGVNVQFTFKAETSGKRRLWAIDTATVTMDENPVMELDNTKSITRRIDGGLGYLVDIKPPTRWRVNCIWLLGGRERPDCRVSWNAR